MKLWLLIAVVCCSADWVRDPVGCQDAPTKYYCTPGSYIWNTLEDNLPSKKAFCDRLIEKKVKLVQFVGDSLVLHLYLAVSMILSGDYAHAGLRWDLRNLAQKCHHGLMYTNAACPGFVATIGTYSGPKVCGGKVHLQFEHCSVCAPRVPFRNNSVVVYGVGMRPYDNKKFQSPTHSLVFDGYRKWVFKAFVKEQMMRRPWQLSQLLWVPPHLPQARTHADTMWKKGMEPKDAAGLAKAIVEFDGASRTFFAQQGVASFSSLNLTKQLSTADEKFFGAPAADGIHYKIGPNLAKGALVLEKVLRMFISEPRG